MSTTCQSVITFLHKHRKNLLHPIFRTSFFFWFFYLSIYYLSNTNIHNFMFPSTGQSFIGCTILTWCCRARSIKLILQRTPTGENIYLDLCFNNSRRRKADPGSRDYIMPLFLWLPPNLLCWRKFCCAFNIVIFR